MRLPFIGFLTCLVLLLNVPLSASGEDPDMLDVMKEELDRSMVNLENASEIPLYNLQYSITEEHSYRASVTNGGFEAPNSSHRRYIDVDLRVGSLELDNTHEIRGGDWWDNYTFRRIVEAPVESDPLALRAALWNETEYQYSKAQERYTKVLANRQVKVEEEDLSNDFSPSQAQQYMEPVRVTEVDTAYWQGIMKKVGSYFTGFPFAHVVT